ncbi:ADP-ribosylglycohydrolase family protein, partial [Desulfococcaceae bacterium HSG8]|nr:ADP-ribosylglycohydrolase family protein [Desulfococcaceae bacterium HSG8]
GRLEHFVKPLTSYHKTKTAGDFTHYGDQMFVLLQSLEASSGFDLNHFGETWKAFFKDYDGYFDKATNATLENFAGGKGPQESGSPSDDLGGASRIAPLAYCYSEDLEKMVEHSRDQTAMTHNNPHVIDAAEFFARVVWKVLKGSKPSDALKSVVDENFRKEPFSEWVTDGMESAEMETRGVISDFGQMCEIGAALPATIHLIVKYENNLKDALVENIMAGGDSAARGMLAGLVLGAYLGFDAIPEEWLSDLNSYHKITQLLK